MTGNMRTGFFSSEHFYKPFFIIFALSSCLSITAVYLCLVLIIIFFLVDLYRQKTQIPLAKDFSIIGSIYIWRAWTLLLSRNFSTLPDLLEIGEKLPYLALSGYTFSRKAILLFFHTLFTVNCVLVVWATLQMHFSFPDLYQNLFFRYRMIGYFGNSLHYAGYISLVSIMCSGLLFFYDKRFGKYLPLLLLGLVFSGSRTYFISTIVAFLFLSILKSKKIFILSIAMIITMYAALTVAPVVTSKRLNLSSDNLQFQIESLKIRLNIWRYAKDLYLDNPVVGIGWHQFAVVYRSNINDFEHLYHLESDNHAHNVFLNELTETGPIGLILILFFVCHFIRKYYLGYKLRNDQFSGALNISLAGCTINIAISGLAEKNFDAGVVWIFLTFIMALAEGQSRNSSSPKDRCQLANQEYGDMSGFPITGMNNPGSR